MPLRCKYNIAHTDDYLLGAVEDINKVSDGICPPCYIEMTGTEPTLEMAQDWIKE
jgi:hypothetical protein